MPSSVAPIPPSLLKMARNNARKMVLNKQKQKQENLTRKLRKVRNNAENKERVEKEFAKLKARLIALKRKSHKKTNSSNKFVKVTSNNLKGYKKTKGRSTTLNRIKRMTKKASKALTRK